MIAECREIHISSWTRILLKRAETISKSARLARRVPRSSRARGKNLEESCQIFKQRSRDDFEVLKNLQRFFGKSPTFLEISNVSRKISNVFLEQVGVFQFDCPTLFAVPTASNHACGLFHNDQQLISSRGVRGACALVW